MSQKKRTKFLNAISTDAPATCSSTRKAPLKSIESPATAAMSPLATDPAATFTTLSWEQQVAATKLKKEFIVKSTERIDDTASFDALAEVFGDVLQWTQYNKTIIVEFWKDLKAIQEHLVNHLTIVRESETTSSFSALLLHSVSPALKPLSKRSEAQHKAVASLAKELEKPKTQKTLSYAAATAASIPAPRSAPPKPKPPPLPSPSEERILVRFDGETPPIFDASYPEIITSVNKHLTSHITVPSSPPLCAETKRYQHLCGPWLNR
ncbi:hypothetical protein B0H11DRAFT_2226018 [Mycena galericulata]|nr:hypothetical protein B0H11DRAFT_2226018 [Mycena galericulata]